MIPITFKPAGKYRFAIDLHDAEQAGLHYDIRIEAQNNDSDTIVLICWTTKKLKDIIFKRKIAIFPTDDHPLSFLTFEGEINKGYGKGIIRKWDTGTYDVIKQERNILILNFKGKKFNGPFAFIPINKKNWLLVKVKYIKEKYEFQEWDISDIL